MCSNATQAGVTVEPPGLRPPPVSDHLSSATAITSNRLFQITKGFQVKSLYLKALVSDYLSKATATSFRAKSLKLSFVFYLPLSITLDR